MQNMLVRWLILTISIILVAQLFDGILYTSLDKLIIASVILSILNVLIRPVFVILTLPFTVLTFGLFLFVINGILLYFTSTLMSGITIDSLQTAVFAAVVISIISMILNKFFVKKKTGSHAK